MDMSAFRARSLALRTISVAVLFLVLSGPNAAWARCEYIVTRQWNAGFTANIRITNDGASTINGWEVAWQYTDGSRRTHAWNADVAGDNPYTATDLDWNSNIEPGVSVEFGVLGNKGTLDGEPNVPVVTGAACGTVNPPPVVPDQGGSDGAGNPSAPGVTCEISYSNVWNDGYQLNVRVNNGGTSAVANWGIERLAALRAIFFAEPDRTLGGEQLPLLTQAATHGYEGLPENQAWVQARTVFASLHVVGSRNGLAPWFGDDAGDQLFDDPVRRLAEVEERTRAALDWIDQSFALAEFPNTRESSCSCRPTPGPVTPTTATPRS